ncbi:MAG: hypothetical protein QOF45_1774 [Gaiellaceae bacterium]|jgi:hypothetical protein|nr:hypothetical protein [Gaiellaceae bacterium]
MSEQAAVANAPTRGATRRVVSNNPNASMALGSGSGLAPLVIWLVGLNGTAIPPEVGAAIGGLMAAVFLFVGRRGIKGAFVGVWRGDQ